MSSEREFERKSPPLPEGWVWTRFGEISLVGAGNPAPQRKEFFLNGIYPFVRVQDMGNLGSKVYLDKTKDYINSKAISKLKLFPKGSVLFTKSGMSILLNQRAVLAQDMYIVSHIGISIPLGNIPSEFLYYWLKTIDFKDLTHATTLPSLQLSKVTAIPTSLPPLPEQYRIVAKIEELFTKLDAGIEALKKIKIQLKRYRQAVLKYAFEGKLTEEWRMVHKIDHNSWKQVKLKECSELITKGESPKWQGFDYVDEGVPFIRSENVLWGTVDVTNTVKIPHEFHKKLSRSQLKPYDVLVNLVGASIGRCCILPSTVKKANINQAVALIRVNDKLDSIFLMHLLLSADIQKKIHEGKVETARPNISLTDLRQLDISLPNMAEQQQIVEEIERRFSIADEIEKTVEQSLKQAERLRQSILKRAFEGKLVPPVCRQAGKDPYEIPPAEEGKYFVYVFKCDDGSLYKGFTTDLLKRWLEHATGKGADWTKQHKPLYLLHWEKVNSLEEAVEREKYLKSGVGREWLKEGEKKGTLNQVLEPANILLVRIKAEKAKFDKEQSSKKIWKRKIKQKHVCR